jgi:hypothetical protein
VAAQNFGGQPEVLTMVMVVGVPGLVLLLASIHRLTRRGLGWVVGWPGWDRLEPSWGCPDASRSAALGLRGVCGIRAMIVGRA